MTIAARRPRFSPTGQAVAGAAPIERMCDKLGGVASRFKARSSSTTSEEDGSATGLYRHRSGNPTGGEELLDALLSTVPWRSRAPSDVRPGGRCAAAGEFFDLTIGAIRSWRGCAGGSGIYGGELGEPFTLAGLCYCDWL